MTRIDYDGFLNETNRIFEQFQRGKVLFVFVFFISVLLNYIEIFQHVGA